MISITALTNNKNNTALSRFMVMIFIGFMAILTSLNAIYGKIGF